MSKEGIYIVAELGVAWRARQSVLYGMVDAAAAAKADAIKLQMFDWNAVKTSPLAEELKPMVIPPAAVYDVASYAKDKGLEVVVTPMYLDAIYALRDMTDVIDGLKIRAKDWCNAELVDAAMASGKRTYISVPFERENIVRPEGMGHREFTSAVLKTHGGMTSRVYCIPKYPPLPSDINLLEAVKQDGYSNHYPLWTVPYNAAWGRILWENMHNTKSRYYLEVHVMPEDALPDNTLDYAVSLRPNELKRLTELVAFAEEMG